jgi:SIR2-like domain
MAEATPSPVMTEAQPPPETISSPASIVLKRTDALTDDQWKVLLKRIQKQKCTPFLGPETCFDFSIPAASVLAEEWADEHNYPFEDRKNLARVAQFVAYKVFGEVDAVKEELADKFRDLKVPDFSHPDDPYRILASLPFSVYINTHYYVLMSLALMSQHKEPQRFVCGWNDTEGDPDPATCDPKPACPLVFHMFGHVGDPRSLVLTEDDYLDFLVRTSVKPELIPQSVQNAMQNNSLLFFGYETNGMDFRVVLRSLYRIWGGKFAGKSSYTIQFVHVSDDNVGSEQISRLKEYFSRYCSASMSIGVYWGSTNEFMIELRQRWEDFRVNSPVG